MKEIAKVWIGAGIIVLIYLIWCGFIEAHEARECSVTSCA